MRPSTLAARSEHPVVVAQEPEVRVEVAEEKAAVSAEEAPREAARNVPQEPAPGQEVPLAPEAQGMKPWEVLSRGLQLLVARVEQLEQVVHGQDEIIDRQEAIIIEFQGTVEEVQNLRGYLGTVEESFRHLEEEVGKLRGGVDYAVSLVGRHHSAPDAATGSAVKAEAIDHDAVKGFMAALAAFKISGESQARVWEFIASARTAARVYDVLSMDASILGPLFVSASPAAAWFLHTVIGSPQKLTVEHALASLGFRFRDDVQVIEREARDMKQGSSQKVQEWRAQVDMLTSRWSHAQRTSEEPLVPEKDKEAWGRVMDRVFQDHAKRIFSDGLRAEFAAALTLPTLDERHAMAVDIEERLLRAGQTPSVSSILPAPDTLESLSAMVRSLTARTGCFSCGQEGHVARECPKRISRSRCYQCGQPGHLRAQCPKRTAKPGNGSTTTASPSGTQPATSGAPKN